MHEMNMRMIDFHENGNKIDSYSITMLEVAIMLILEYIFLKYKY